MTPLQKYRTSDMALATFLKQNGHSVQEIIWAEDSESVFWVFVSLPTLLEAVNLFHQGLATVEPREFCRLFALTKREMYRLSDPHKV